MKNAIINAMNSTWEAIAMDVLEISDGSASKDLVIEMVLDASRVESYGNLNDEELKYYKDLNFEEKIKIANEAFTYPTYGY